MVPIEVKAEGNVRANSLTALLGKRPELHAERFSMLPYKVPVSYTHIDVYKRQGYMIDSVARYIQTDIFAEIRSRDVEFPKISFDYEVAEKAQSVAVVPFAGRCV